MSSSKTPLLQQQQHQQNDQSSTKRVQSQIDDTKVLMADNIHLAISRGQKMNELDEKSVMLENESARFHEKSSQVRRNMCFNRYRQVAILVLVGIAVIAFISLMIYFATKKKN